MNIFNRIVMILLILLLLALVILIMILPVTVGDVALGGVATFQELIQSYQFFTIMLLFCGLLIIFLLLLLWLELRRPQIKTVRLNLAKDGDVQLGVQSVAQSLEYRIDELAGVRKVETQVLSHGRDVTVKLNLDTSPAVDVPALSEQVVELARRIVEEQLGLRIRGKVHINIRHEPYPRGTMPVLAQAERDARRAPRGAMPVTRVATQASSAPAAEESRLLEAGGVEASPAVGDVAPPDAEAQGDSRGQ